MMNTETLTGPVLNKRHAHTGLQDTIKRKQTCYCIHSLTDLLYIVPYAEDKLLLKNNPCRHIFVLSTDRIFLETAGE